MTKERKEYPIKISPEILELLGPSLYSNIYYVLAELIANSYDADAQNVWIDITDNSISVEDDGNGMSYDEGDINVYLSVAKSTRNTDDDSTSKQLKRPKMGRKGIGKLAALAISDRVNVMTKSKLDNDVSGFILSRTVPKNDKLVPLLDNQITFKHIKDGGTRVEMLSPEFELPKQLATFKRNIVKFFPNVGKDFVIHVWREDEKVEIDDFVSSMGQTLDSLIIYGNDFSNIEDYFRKNSSKYAKKNYKKKEVQTKKYIIKNKNGEEEKRELQVKGWIGTYSSTRGLKADKNFDFPDNFLAIYSHEKLGQFNILQQIGANRLYEVYVVGQFYVDEFEETSLPDMALSNRQGYKVDDIRYTTFLEIARKSLSDVLQLKQKALTLKKEGQEKSKKERRKKEERALEESVEKGITAISTVVEQKGDLHRVINEVLTDMGIKKISVDKDSKKILLSHTQDDAKLNDIIYSLLQFNGFEPKEIIYTNSGDVASSVPYGVGIYDYLRDFFIQTYSKKPIFVVYIYSDNSCASPGVMHEVGAGWIVQTDHGVVKAGTNFPTQPLDIDKRFAEVILDKEDVFCTDIGFLTLHEMLEHACKLFQKDCHTKEENKDYFKSLGGEILTQEEFKLKRPWSIKNKVH